MPPPDTPRRAGPRWTAYAFDPFDGLLLSDPSVAQLPLLSDHGGNVTVGVVAGESAPTRALLDSIRDHYPEFAGELLVAQRPCAAAQTSGDHGGDDGRLPPSRRITIAAQMPIAAIRNTLLEAATHDWVILLDGRLVLDGNLFFGLRRCVTELGAHFANLPIRPPGEDSAEGHQAGHLGLTITDGRIAAAAETIRVEAPPCAAESGLLSTHLNGLACAVFRPTLTHLGNYDPQLTADMADIDLSIRIFRAGLKIGNTPDVVLAWQDGRQPPESETQAAETDALRAEAARHFREKYAFLPARCPGHEGEPPEHEDAADEVPPPTSAHSGHEQRRPRVALIIDREDWAFANIARQVRRHLGDRFEFDTIPVAVVDNLFQVLLMVQHCDLVHFFWRELPHIILSDWMRSYVQSRGESYDAFMSQYVRSKALSVSVYDHLHLEPAALEERRPIYAELLDAYYVGSERLRKIYEKIPDYPTPVSVLQDGVDLELFYPQQLERFQAARGQEIVIGWVGNSAWNLDLDDFKGVRTILRPAIEQLRAEGLSVRAQFVDRAEGTAIAHAEMVDYYRQIDLYVCTSKIEGTPNPVLESMACGVPIVTTDVGIVPEAFGPQQREFILAERSVACLKEAIRRLSTRPERLAALSRENLKQVRSWDWKIRVRGFADFFQTCLARRDARLERTRTPGCLATGSG